MRSIPLWERRYPTALSCLKSELSRLPDVVFEAFVANSGLHEQEARHALTLNGSDPLLWIADLGVLDGLFNSSAPRRISIHAEMARRFEGHVEDPRAKTFLQAKVLHELVHWARFSRSLPEPQEMGVQFELDAYGSVPTRFWSEDAVLEQGKSGGRAASEPSIDHGASPVADGERLFTGDDVRESHPRGIRNNNPGNIKRTGIRWEGLADERDMTAFQRRETVFCVFSEPRWGIRAMARTLANYQRLHGLRTVSEMIRRWAPPHDDNDSERYGEFVAERMALRPEQSFSFNDPRLAEAMVTAVITFENGMQPYAASQIAKATADGRPMT